MAAHGHRAPPSGPVAELDAASTVAGMEQDAIAIVLAQVLLAIRSRLEHGNPSPIVRHELETLLRVAQDEASHQGVRLPE